MLPSAFAVFMPPKKILLISPQAWGKMFVAKHHYAVELSRSGNEVYFLNPPVYRKKNFLQLSDAPGYQGLKIIEHACFSFQEIEESTLQIFQEKWLR